MKQPTWIWYYGDFEVHHCLKVNTRRLENNLFRLVPWKQDDCWHIVFFRKIYHLEQPEKIRATVDGKGSLVLNDKHFPLNQWTEVPAGNVTVVVEAFNITGLPSVFVEGQEIISDGSWEATYDGSHYHPVGCWTYNDRTVTPEHFLFAYSPLELEELSCANGTLFDAGRETFARLDLKTRGEGQIRLYYGESLEEALNDDPNQWIVLQAEAHIQQPARAMRYLRIVTDQDVTLEQVRAEYEYLPIPRKGKFSCDNEMMNRIWEISCYTLELNSREFYLDGIKRDRYVWSGDAYQSYLLNYYLNFEPEICKRTMLALRGKDPFERHINTIMDYSFYWVLGLKDYYLYTGDLSFVRAIYPKLESLLAFCISRSNSDGLLEGKPDDWIFVDWAENLDKDGPICVEQILFVCALDTAAFFGRLIGKSDNFYQNLADRLRGQIQERYWCEDKGAFIDSFTSGRKSVSRQTNIFALRYGIAEGEQAELIRKNVLENDAVPQITTPYFKFYEMECLCALGHQQEVTNRIVQYWGGMLDLGATSFWEEYDPSAPADAHYTMYGTPFAKSLCHAWGASPIYLLGRFYLGVTPTAPGYASYVVEPNTGGLAQISGVVPVPGGEIKVTVEDGHAQVLSDIPGGVLRYGKKQVPIEPGVLTQL